MMLPRLLLASLVVLLGGLQPPRALAQCGLECDEAPLLAVPDEVTGTCELEPLSGGGTECACHEHLQFVGTGGGVLLSTCPEEGGFGDYWVQVREGDCSAPQLSVDRPECLLSSEPDSTVVICETDPDTTYHVSLGYRDVDPGPYRLVIKPATESATDCEDAELLPMGQPTAFDTTCAGRTRDLDRCEDCPSSRRDDVWSRVNGTGGVLEAVAVLGPDGPRANVTVHQGECGDLECLVSAESSGDGQEARVRWCAEAGDSYFIKLAAAASSGVREGALQLTVREVQATCNPNRACGDGSESISESTTVALTLSGEESAAAACADGDVRDDRWYSVIGDGGDILVSTCPSDGGDGADWIGLSHHDGCTGQACEDLSEPCLESTESGRRLRFAADEGELRHVRIFARECGRPSEVVASIAYVDAEEDEDEQDPCLNNPSGEECTGIPEGCEKYALGRDEARADTNRTGEGDILLHSGQERRVEQDLFIAGLDAASHFDLKRKHLTRVIDPNSPFGPAWDTNLNHSLEERRSGTLVVRGYGRADLFHPVEGDPGAWRGGLGRTHRITVRDEAQRVFRLRLRGGTTVEYDARLLPRSGLRSGRVRRIVSPAGNSLTFSYDESSANPAEWTLRRVTDAFGRDIDFFHEDPRFPRLVTRVRDFSGREVRYLYDELANLVSVTTPAVTNAGPADNDFPAGKTTEYAYLDSADPRMRHALAAVTAPAEVALGVPRPRLRWVYDLVPSSESFGWVKEYTVGFGPDGGTYRYEYSFPASPAPGAPEADPMAPGVITDVVDRRGARMRYTLTRFGQMLEERHVNSLRVDGPSNVTRRFEFTPDGSLKAELRPNGTLVEYQHVDPTVFPRLAHANVDAIVTRAATGETIRQEVLREPVYNRPFRVIDPRGFEPGNDPVDFTTVYEYGYMEDLDQAAADHADALGMDEQELLDLFASLGIVDLPDVNGDGVEGEDCACLVRVRHPEVREPEPQTAEETWRYNAHGQVTHHRDPEGNVTEYEYYSKADPAGLASPDASSAAGGGYLKAVIRDTSDDPLRNSGTGGVPLRQRSEVRYDSPGPSFPANPRGVATQVIDPRGVRSWIHVNERDQVVRTVRAAEAPAPLTPIDVESIIRYDMNDRVIEQRIENVGALGDQRPFLSMHFEYDINDNLRRRRQDIGGPLSRTGATIPLDPREVVTEWRLDASENVIEKLSAVGTTETKRETWAWDERDLLISHSVFLEDGSQSKVTTAVDENGNRVARIDATGDETRFVHDGFDRVREIIDAAGHRILTVHDAASLAKSVERRGPVTPGEPEVRLSKVWLRHDRRGRTWKTERWLDHLPGRVAGTLTPGAGSSDANKVLSIVQRDRNGRAVKTIDAEADVHRTTWDGLGRVVEHLDPVGNRWRPEWTASGDLKRLLEYEKRPDGTSELYESLFEHDAMRRLTQVVEPNGATSRAEYDSRGYLAKTTDALGNVIEYRRDRRGRQLRKDIYLKDGGTGANPLSHDAVARLSTEWDLLGRMTRRVDDGGKETRYTVDALGRIVFAEHGDGTTESWSYSLDGELETHVDANGSVLTWKNDALGRPTEMTVDHGLPRTRAEAIAGTLRRTWSYDGLGRVVEEMDDNGAGPDVTFRYWYDSLSRVVREHQDIEGKTSLHVDSSYDGSGREVRVRYPSGREVVREHDGLERLRELREGDAAAELIARYSYIGPRRDARIEFGNGATLDLTDPAAYDANRRLTERTWRKGDSVITSHLYGYDGVDGVGTNRRSTVVAVHRGTVDVHERDSRQRLVRFQRFGGRAAPVDNERSFQGAGKMASMREGLVDRRPVVDGDSSEAGQNQYSAFDGAPRIYDDAGSLRSDGRLRFVRDVDGRIAEVRDQATDEILVVCVYGPDSRRVLTTEADGSQTRTVHSGWAVLEERDEFDQPVRQHVSGRRLDEHVQIKELLTGQAAWLHLAEVDSVSAVTDGSGKKLLDIEYDWLGAPRAHAAPSGVELPAAAVFRWMPYGFQGRRYDATTGLYHFRHRDYDPRVGEFVSIDPTGKWRHQNGNGYDAFLGDPWSLRDPLGQSPTLEFLGGVADGVSGTWKEQLSGYGELVRAAREQGYREFLGGLTQGVGELGSMVADGRWGALGQTLAPAMMDAVRCWGSASAYGRGLLSGGLIAEVGPDALITLATGGAGALAAIGRKGLDVGLDVLTSANRLRRAERAADLVPDAPGRSCATCPPGWTKCFAAGTPVQTAGGPVAIEQLAEGDLIWTRHPATGVVSLEPVSAVFETAGQEVLGVLLAEGEGAGRKSELTCTPDHPIWVVGEGWHRAEDLEPGDALLSWDGEPVRVLGVERTGERESVYNVEVQGAHAYFAGEAGAWVHNMGDCDVGGGAGAADALQGARLKEHLRQLEKYGTDGFRELDNGRIRYDGILKPARTPGEMAGARVVREWDPGSGGTRTWIETLDHNGTVRIVRPETGGPKVHHVFDADGNHVGTR